MKSLDQQLIDACRRGDIQTAQTLLQQGANPNAKDLFETIPIFMRAAENGNIPMLQLLVKHGANPSITDRLGKNALHYAVKNHQYDTVEYLITQLHLDPNIQDCDGIAPFMIAAENGDIKMLQLLLQLGANPSITDRFNQNALHYAAKKQQHNTAQYLITKLQFNIKTKNKYDITPFIIAIKNGDIQLLKLLLQHGEDPNFHTNDWPYPSAIHIAAENGHNHIIQFLIQHGANPYTTDILNQNPVHYAVAHRRYDTVKYLITQLHLNPNTQDKDGITPFMIALKKVDIPMLKLLLQLGANPNFRTKEWPYPSAIHIAAENGYNHIIQLLIQHGVNPYTTDILNRNPIHYAVAHRRYDTVKYLITQLHLNLNTKTQSCITPFMIAARNGDIKMLKLLLQLGANPYTTDHHGRTALHHAVENNQYYTAKYLITQLQFDPNTKDNDGITPFMIAAINGDIKMLKILLQLGANPYTTDKEGQNAIDYAQYPTTIDFLISVLHLNPNNQDHQGNTPLLTFLKNGKISNAKTIIQLGTHPNIPNHQGQKPTAMPNYNEIQLKKAQPSTITL